MRPGIDAPGLGVGLIVRRADGKVLMCRRLKAPEAGCWSIVGGKVDAMEPAVDAARREAEEETGLTFGRIDFLCVAEVILPQENQHWVSLIYLTEEIFGEPRLVEPDKHADLRFFGLDELPQPLSRFAEQAFAQLPAK
jgi:ADP-ribose pyrophosphatase YjhB (NUDIX family)